MAVATSVPNPLTNLNAEQIREALNKLSPEARLALRKAAVESGLSQGENFKRNLDGSIQITVTIPVDLASGLMSMVELANEPAHTYIEGIILDGINGWFAGRGPEEEITPPAATSTIPVGTKA